MTDAYGEYADVEAGERPAAAGCVDVNSCTPMRGAIQIESSLVACSYGFNSVGNTSPNIRMLTANHCNYNHIQNAYDYTFYHDGNLIGTEYAGEESMSGDFMKVPRSAGSAQRNWVYYTDAQQQYVINSVPGEASQNTGDPIHFSGYRHLGVDGEMLDVDICWWKDTPGNPLVCGAKASTEMYGNPITLLSGDSGGPLFYSGAALGISSSVASGVVYYSFVTRAEDELNVSICITQACGI